MSNRTSQQDKSYNWTNPLIICAVVITSAGFVLLRSVTAVETYYYINNINSQERQSYNFSSHSYEKPVDSQLSPDLTGYLSNNSSEILNFLGQRINDDPKNANFLSQKLRSHTEIINEAQRIHFNVIGDVLKGFRAAMLFDIAAFENKGDPAITAGEILFLARIHLPVIYYCTAHCKESQYKAARELARKYKPDELVILLHGGGNIIGYAESDMNRIKALEIFAGYQLVLFPNSVYIVKRNHPHVAICQKAYCCNKNFTIILRDSQSYGLAKELFTGETRLLMAPDMAFQIGNVPRFQLPVFDVLWVKRQDRETLGYDRKSIPHHAPDLRVHISDWWAFKTNTAPSSLERAFYIVTNGFTFLSRGRVVVSDRLHGHILAILMNIPHVIIDNKQKKLSAYHNTWTRGLDNTLLTDKPAQALPMVIKLLDTYKDQLPPRVPFLDIGEDFLPMNFTKQEYITYA